MPVFERILVGTDFSRSADAALFAALAIARRTGAHIDVFHAVDRPQPASQLVAARERLERRDDLGEARLHVESGGPGELLHALRESVDPDLIVLGASGQHRLRRLLLGGLCERAIHTPGCPLLVVRDVPRGGLFKRILVGLEDPDRARPALEEALGVAHQLRGELAVLHVLPPEGYVSDRRRVELSPETVPTRLEHLVARLDPTIPVDIEVCRGDPAQEIPRTARKLGAELVVLGAERGERGWPGPVAARITAAGLPATLLVWDEAAPTDGAAAS